MNRGLIRLGLQSKMLLLFMVIGHAAMAFVHRRQGGEDVLARMIGR